jgi:hypothetical protein
MQIGYITKNVYACGVIDNACTIFASENRLFLGEFEAEFKKALARESGAQGALFDEKTEGRKFRDTAPFKQTKNNRYSRIQQKIYG